MQETIVAINSSAQEEWLADNYEIRGVDGTNTFFDIIVLLAIKLSYQAH